MDLNNYRTFKDFLTFYNLMSETCFTQCIDNFNSRKLDVSEEKCVENCMGKYISYNHRIMGIYALAQQKLMQKRIEEHEQLTKESQESNTTTTSAINQSNELDTTNEIKNN